MLTENVYYAQQYIYIYIYNPYQFIFHCFFCSMSTILKTKKTKQYFFEKNFSLDDDLKTKVIEENKDL